MGIKGKIVREAKEIWTDVTEATTKVIDAAKSRKSSRQKWESEAGTRNPQSVYDTKGRKK